MRSNLSALAQRVIWRFHAVSTQSISASPRPSSGMPPPPEKHVTSTESTCSELSSMRSTDTMVFLSSIGARWFNSLSMWISGKPN